MKKSKKAFLYAILTLALLIMLVFRIDWWWWGEDMELIWGLFTLPMLYHLGIWAVGWILVILVAIFFWPDEEDTTNNN